MLEQGATHVGVATDHVVESFRNDLWLGLQDERGHGAGAPRPVPAARGRRCGRSASRCGPMVEVEADDGLASAARRRPRRRPRVDRVFICTPDKDLGQCVEDPKVVQLDRRQDRRARRGGRCASGSASAPRSIPDYLALVGDTRRRLPGPPGLGREVDRHRARPLRAPRRHPRRRTRVGGRRARRRQARGRRSPARARRPSCSSTSPRCALDADVGAVDDWEWRGAAPELARVGAAPRRREPRDAVRAPGERSASADGDPLMERSSSRSGRTGTARSPTGPADGELVLLLHGFPETSYEWRGAARGARCGRLPRGRARPARLHAGRAAGRRRRLPRRPPRRRRARVRRRARRRAVPPRRATTGAASSPGTRAARHGDRLRTLTVVSTPHPAPFRGAMRHSGSDQRERSSYMEWFRSADAEAAFLADDAALLDAAYAEHPADAAAEYRRVFTADDGAALTGGLNWYRANNFARRRSARSPRRRCTCGRPPTSRSAGRRPRAPRRRSPARTASRCSRA